MRHFNWKNEAPGKYVDIVS